MLRLRAKLAAPSEPDGPEFVASKPHPSGAVASAGRDLVQLNNHIQAKTSTITGDVLRSYGPHCPNCDAFHHPNVPSRSFVEILNSPAAYLGIVDGDPRQVVIVTGHDDNEPEPVRLALRAGKTAETLTGVPPGVLFNFRIDRNGHAKNDPTFTCYDERVGGSTP